MTESDGQPAFYGKGYWAHMGIESLGKTERGASNRIRLQPFHMNYNGVVHGGVISGLIDSTAGAAVRIVRSQHEVDVAPHATSDLHVAYLAGARGTEILATGRVTKAGRTAIFVEVDVFDDRSELVARGMVTFVISQRMRVREEE